MNMKRKLLLFFVTFCLTLLIYSKEYVVKSPDGNIKITVTANKQICWSIDYKGEQILKPSFMNLLFEKSDNNSGTNPVVRNARFIKSDYIETAIVPTKQRKIRNQFNQLTLNCKGESSIVFRVYNMGAAYRFETSKKQTDIFVQKEQFEANLPEGCMAYWPREKNQEYMTHCEGFFDYLSLKDLTPEAKGYLPIYLSTPKGTKVVITEADLFDYPNLFLAGNGDGNLKGEFPPVVLKSELKKAADRDEVLVEKASYIANTKGNRTYPWRVLMINENDKAVLENNLVYQLSSPAVTTDTDWIKPGKISWDWWSTLNVYGVDFKAGVNTDTYKYFIDFASKFGIEYILLDEGWSVGTWNIKEAKKGLDIQELVKYGKERNVGLVLWTLWNPLSNDMESIFDTYNKWGIKGVKVDFMQRSDQGMVNFYEKVAKTAMDRKLLVDFHGSYKPSGLQKKYPNVMTFEGVLGLEHDKDSRDINPKHDLILPFTRMTAGPMDYTPGAVGNATAEDFYINFVHPISQGTRAHQAALYIVYESPLQMLADSPSSYYKAQEFISFISRIPTVWDETKALSAKIGEQLVIARRNGDKWYIGGLTDWNDRTIEVTLDFLDSSKYKIEIFKDGCNANVYASDFALESKTITNGDKIAISMAKGGGWAAIITPVK